MAIDDYIGVRSTIIDNQESDVGQESTRGSTFIFGTGTRGSKHTPIDPGISDVETVFGAVPLDATFETSLVRGYYEFKQSCKTNHPVYLVRVGDTAPAKLSLFEHCLSNTSGETAYTLGDDGFPVVALTITAVVDGAEYNGAKVKISKDAKDPTATKPNHMLIELPDGTSVGFNLSMDTNAAGVISTISDLVARINAHPDLSGKIVASYTPIVKDIEVIITGDGQSKDKTYDLAPVGLNESWGDKIDDINSAYIKKNVTVNIDAGSVSVSLPYAVQKDMLQGESIGRFIHIADQEAVLTVGLADAGRNSITKSLYCSKVHGWDAASYAITGSVADDWTFVLSTIPKNGVNATAINRTFTGTVATAQGETGTTVVLTSVKDIVVGMPVSGTGIAAGTTVASIDTATKTVTLSAATSSALELDDTITFAVYVINATTGAITIYRKLALGDIYLVSYRYEVAYAEAKKRSDMLIGDTRSYFVYGDTIIFGAEQPANIIAYYNTKVYFDTNSLVIDDRLTSTITFDVDTSELPAVGEKVYVNISFQPELPAATGTIFTNADGDSKVQAGALSGGSDGKITSKTEYIKAVQAAMEAVDLYPRKCNVIMGMYLDDVELKPDYDTGLPSKQALNMVNDIMPYVLRASKYTEECTVVLPVRPLVDLSQSGINTWLDRLIYTSATDKTRPANIIDGFTDFRIDVPLGVFLISHSQINGGTSYLMNPACLYAACKADLAYTESMVRQNLPGNIKDLGVKIFNAEVIGNLNAKRYSTAIVDERGRFVWADAPTLAIRGRSQFDRQYVRDVTYEAIARARVAAEKYLGKPMEQKYLIPMRKDVGNALLEMVKEGSLTDAFCNIVSVAGGQITGKTKLQLKLATAREIREVELETSITLG